MTTAESLEVKPRRWRIKSSAFEHFMSFVMPVTETGCWIWIGAITDEGYGHFYYHGEKFGAHRWSYEYHKEKIPKGFFIDHLCRIRCCVNPSHLRAVTPKVNSLENSLSPTAINAKKTHCKHGHEFTPENTYYLSGGRLCSTCQKENSKRNYRLTRKQKNQEKLNAKRT